MVSNLTFCPFCGSISAPTIRVYKGQDGWRDRYAVLCRYDEGGCGAEGGMYHSEAEAVESWNRRWTKYVVGVDLEKIPETTQDNNAYQFAVEEIKTAVEVGFEQAKRRVAAYEGIEHERDSFRYDANETTLMNYHLGYADAMKRVRAYILEAIEGATADD